MSYINMAGLSLSGDHLTNEETNCAVDTHLDPSQDNENYSPKGYSLGKSKWKLGQSSDENIDAYSHLMLTSSRRKQGGNGKRHSYSENVANRFAHNKGTGNHDEISQKQCSTSTEDIQTKTFTYLNNVTHGSKPVRFALTDDGVFINVSAKMSAEDNGGILNTEKELQDIFYQKKGPQTGMSCENGNVRKPLHGTDLREANIWNDVACTGLSNRKCNGDNVHNVADHTESRSRNNWSQRPGIRSETSTIESEDHYASLHNSACKRNGSGDNLTEGTPAWLSATCISKKMTGSSVPKLETCANSCNRESNCTRTTRQKTSNRRYGVAIFIFGLLCGFLTASIVWLFADRLKNNTVLCEIKQQADTRATTDTAVTYPSTTTDTVDSSATTDTAVTYPSTITDTTDSRATTDTAVTYPSTTTDTVDSRATTDTAVTYPLTTTDTVEEKQTTRATQVLQNQSSAYVAKDTSVTNLRFTSESIEPTKNNPTTSHAWNSSYATFRSTTQSAELNTNNQSTISNASPGPKQMKTEEPQTDTSSQSTKSTIVRASSTHKTTLSTTLVPDETTVNDRTSASLGSHFINITTPNVTSGPEIATENVRTSFESSSTSINLVQTPASTGSSSSSTSAAANSQEDSNHKKRSIQGGYVYIRWGKSSCPSHDDELYKGYVAGGNWQHSGGATNTICLPEVPKWGSYRDELDGDRALIYGTEYGSTDQIFSKLMGNSLKNKDMPCSACQATSRLSHVMIPGSLECMPGWTLEYTGYLMGSGYAHSRSSELICVDSAADHVAGSDVVSGGNFLYFAEVRTGSLPSPPYVNGRELACVVCTL